MNIISNISLAMAEMSGLRSHHITKICPGMAKLLKTDQSWCELVGVHAEQGPCTWILAAKRGGPLTQGPAQDEPGGGRPGGQGPLEPEGQLWEGCSLDSESNQLSRKLLLLFDKGCSFSAACGDRRGADCALRPQIHTEVSTHGSVLACRQKAVEEGAILVPGRNMKDPVFGAALFLQQRQDAPDLTWSGCGGKRLYHLQWAWGEVCGIVTRGQIERGSWSLCFFWKSP